MEPAYYSSVEIDLLINSGVGNDSSYAFSNQISLSSLAVHKRYN